MKNFVLLLSILFLTACANIQDTVVPMSDLSLKKGLSGTVIYSEGCTSDGANLKVSHYQGIFRMPQPSFIGGFPQKERDTMLNLSVQSAAFAFFRQLSEAGADVRLYTQDMSMEKGSLRLVCAITRIKIGIYDNGWGGYGSAGDFWEAETDFSTKVIRDGREYPLQPVTGKGQLKHAPISPGSFLDVLILSAKMATAAVNGSMFGVVKEGFIDYKIDRDAKSPVEPAAGIAGQEAAKQIALIR